MFSPPLALASLSGESDADWARSGADYAGCAFLGGIAIDDRSRAAARELVARDRTEFLPDDPLTFVDRQLQALEPESTPIQPAVNVRSATREPIRDVAQVCHEHDALLEINAHCRQDELCAVGCGETLLADTDRLAGYVETAASTSAAVGVKVRAEVPGVELPVLAGVLESAGASFVHVDAMDTESVIAEIADATDLFVIANNGVRDEETVREYVEYGADAVSVGRPSDNPVVLERVHDAVVAQLES
ncbi:putative dihydropyrimidine dehydrogenase [Natrialba magadii ATCC 43099]|uniref:Dihydropyrimidine dehydrogenase n=1 Tax=Natrialba magadii (strain ATCC 43099 / DSM 3394 / CCM 3739 / CIP 104546 / IAM 13178 / JCM 8861 / NBRC 102185 / NCIMB 2190 / MS3) TaxID=547559 RepID=D3SYT9_NATMM|nr:tRNA-dihydrouridine synthase [Natrialba magadii]ADD04200.1 putative dihydropyrimidine dehydrogenase [Natrialba magadii ATCC 43099]ELY26604.1 dihydropyrimidine dehydrogenase [Natrialba magadii ATCC 43099]